MAAAIATGLLGSVVVVFYFFFLLAGNPRRKTLPNCSWKLLFSPLAAKTDFLVLFMKNEAKC